METSWVFQRDEPDLPHYDLPTAKEYFPVRTSDESDHEFM